MGEGRCNATPDLLPGLVRSCSSPTVRAGARDWTTSGRKWLGARCLYSRRHFLFGRMGREISLQLPHFTCYNRY